MFMVLLWTYFSAMCQPCMLHYDLGCHWSGCVWAGDGPNAELRVDLKGVIYSAVLVPSACSLAVGNISGTEARVESLTSSFMQLTREAGLSGDGDDVNNHSLWDDDDNYQASITCDHAWFRSAQLQRHSNVVHIGNKKGAGQS